MMMGAVCPRQWILLVLLCALAWQCQPAHSWGYQMEGHDWQWNCHNPRESPIEIMPHDTVFDPQVEPLELVNYDLTHGLHFDLLNNGHTVEIVLSGETYAEMAGALLPGRYKLERLHLHWGKHMREGSEHRIQGHRSGMEVHLVHRNVKYSYFTEAVNNPDGIAVLAVMYEVSADESEEARDLSPIMEEVIASIPNITVGNSVRHRIHPYPLTHFLPYQSWQSFYQYHGSISTPPCTESVAWIVLAHRRLIGHAQWAELHRLLDVDNNTILANFRDTQPINRRTVYRSFEINGCPPTALSATHLTWATWLLILLVYSGLRLRSTIAQYHC